MVYGWVYYNTIRFLHFLRARWRGCQARHSAVEARGCWQPLAVAVIPCCQTPRQRDDRREGAGASVFSCLNKMVVVVAAAGFMEKTRLFIMFTIYLLYGCSVSEQCKKKNQNVPTENNFDVKYLIILALWFNLFNLL